MLEATALATFADYSVKVGVPAAMGLVILYYLLAKIIPGQQEVFKYTLASQQETFKKAIDDIILDANQRTDKMLDAIRLEHAEIRVLLKSGSRASRRPNNPPVETDQ